MAEHLLLLAWLLWLQAWRDVGAQKVCPHNETRCEVNADAANIYVMKCAGYGAVAQLPPACTETRVISNLVIGQGTTVDRLQQRILDGLQMRQLELIGLGIMSINESAFEAISRHLQVLHLQDNRLESLPLGVFRTLSSLSRLQLHNNRLTQLSDGVFDGLTSLVYLTLHVNRISAVDSGTWNALPRLVTLILEDNRLGDAQLVFPETALGRLEELRLDKNGLGTINDDIISGLPNLRRLYFGSNGVESLPRNVFRANHRLQMVDLSSNNISQLTGASFNGLTSLITLVLDVNDIQELPDSLFLALNALRILRLRENKISDVYSNSFTGLVGLRELDLSGNRIPMLPLGLFDPLGLLETLLLANNEIRHVEQMPFQSCRNLRSIDMTNNLLPSVSADWFNSTTRLTFLKLAHNRIKRILAGAFDQLQQLEELDLSENYLSDLRNDSFTNCRSLRKLNLARNPLRQLASPGTTFSGLTALRQLDLTGCCITKLVLNSSAPLPALTELHLCDNLLTNVTRHSLAAATNLQRLNLADNKIAAIEAGALSSLTSLNWLNLSRNLLTGDQLAAAVQSALSGVVVDVSWNRVKSIASLSTPFRGIYMSGNPLVCSCTSPSWISLADTSRFLDATTTICYSGSEPAYLLCYWSRCGPSTDHQLCTAPLPSITNSSLFSSPSKTCRLDAALTMFGPRFIDFDAHAMSPTSAQVSWNVSDEFGTMAGFQLTFTVVDNCTNATAAVFSLTGNETSYTIHNYDVNRTTIDVGNLTSGELYVTCAYVLQTPTGSSNRTSVSDTQCTCLELPAEIEQTTTASPSPTTTTTQTQTTTAVKTTTTTTTTTTTLPTTTTTTTKATTTTKIAETTTAVETSANAIEITSTLIAMTTTIIHTPTVDLRIWTTSNETTIFITWITQNATDKFAYFWLIIFDGENRQVASADVVGHSYVIGNLSHSSTYNVCITAVTFHDHMDLTRCVVVQTDDPPRGNAVDPSTGDTGVFLLIVVAVPTGCLLIVLIIICIAICYHRRRQRRRRNKPTEAEMTSTSSCDSSAGNGGQNSGYETTSCSFNSPLSEQSVTTMNIYDDVIPSAPPLQDQSDQRYWNSATDPLPLQSSLSLNMYDDALSY